MSKIIINHYSIMEYEKLKNLYIQDMIKNVNAS